jgi:putative ABC transport system permease protein
MRVQDVLQAGFTPFWRQKLRSALTTLGVTIGIATLVASIAVGVGVRRVIDEGFRRQNQLREIQIYPGHQEISDEIAGVPPEALHVEGDMDEAQRARIKRHLARDWRAQQNAPVVKPLTLQRLQELGSIPHVVNVEPSLQQMGRVILAGKVTDADCVGLTRNEASINTMLIAGRAPGAAPHEIVVHEYLLYRLGVQDTRAMHELLGRRLSVEFTDTRQRRPELLLTLFNVDRSKLTEVELQLLAKMRDQLPQSIATLPLSAEEKSLLQVLLARKKPKDPAEKIYPSVRGEFTVVGIIRSRTKEEEKIERFPGANVFGEVIFRAEPATAFFARAPRRIDEGFSSAVLTVDSDENLKDVCNQLKAEGHQFFAIGLYLQTAKKNALLIGFTMDFVALIALSVAFLGIMNTMFTAVLERTKEIGIMKSIGAKDRQILLLFLIEGTMIGAVGGGLGLLVGWLVSFPGDNIALQLIREQDPNMPPVKTVFQYPWWLVLGAPLFAMVVTTLAGVLPARRAARIEPVVALRHE